MATKDKRAALAAKRGWLYTGWRKCADDRHGMPRYLRCRRDLRLITHGQIAAGGCVCGERRCETALALTPGEALLLKLGWFPLSPAERLAIRPLCPTVAGWLRAKVFGT